MSDYTGFKEIGVSLDGIVATVEMRRPPHNFFDSALIAEIGEAFERLDADPACRAIVLAAEGRSFLRRRRFFQAHGHRHGDGSVTQRRRAHLYKEGIRLFRTKKADRRCSARRAVGGGLGLALVPDFRVTCTEARFSANFNRLGFHPGFGLTATLPRLVGAQQAALLFYNRPAHSGRRGGAHRAADMLVAQDEVRGAAQALALEIAQSAPLAVISTRETVRRGLVDLIEAATERERSSRTGCARTEDFQEGIKAMAERRLPNFQGR